jgi:dCTP deaminase
MSILTGPAIVVAYERGEIQIERFRPEMINPASIDLTLGDQVRTYDTKYVIDSRLESSTHLGYIQPAGFVLYPGVGHLMHTAERIGSTKYVPVLDGKSSVGRLFVQVHATAGYGDIGFFGQWTLEVTVTHPVRVYAGMRIAQMRFHEAVGEIMLYKGNYKEDAIGPVASRAHRQFDGLP